ncbi:MAG: hypothetical protein RMZ41_029915 [Nostoc sp. DedVER02]|uniref:hypothetical protein n=1 Tax=unclassified Nostoc TaxID=2593658 RepID=UPI002AD4AF5D|nr:MULTISPECIES: hypothetical protein [unclassified Nostoc]MDZ7989571.1 hypothetical protein [Nostoc sp. DedVER02]MDZ8116102.1 hypothetical protein [Nostoc sp. DedVER01b]
MRSVVAKSHIAQRDIPTVDEHPSSHSCTASTSAAIPSFSGAVGNGQVGEFHVSRLDEEGTQISTVGFPIVVSIATDSLAVADDHDITVEQGLHHARNSDVRFELDSVSPFIAVGLEDSIAEGAYRVPVSVVGALSYLIQCHRFNLLFFLCLTIR